jgi:hypothetical protein
MLNDTCLKFDSSKKLLTAKVESTEEDVAVQPKITKIKPKVVRNSLNHQVGSTRKNGLPKFESQFLQDSTKNCSWLPKRHQSPRKRRGKE